MRGEGLCWVDGVFDEGFFDLEDDDDEEGFWERLLAPLEEPVFTFVGAISNCT